jgi:hypothetical protein
MKIAHVDGMDEGHMRLGYMTHTAGYYWGHIGNYQTCQEHIGKYWMSDTDMSCRGNASRMKLID